MEKKTEEEVLNGLAKGCMGPICIAVLLLATLLLAGCKTKEVIEVCKTDTLKIVRTDTVREREVRIERVDSVVHDSVVVERDSAGKVVYLERWRDRLVRIESRDSVDKYRALVDSLREVGERSEVRTETVVKTKADRTGWWALGGLVCVLVAARLICRKK